VEERKEIVNKHISKGMKAEKAAAIAGFSRSGYYYKPNGKKPGKRPSVYTKKKNGNLVKNTQVVEEIKKILKPDFIDYGYDKVKAELITQGFIINRKKVYRLMKQHNLLNPVHFRGKISKKYVKYSQPYPAFPLQFVEIDIKYIYISGENKNAYLITILDVFNREALAWILSYSMKSTQVIELLDELIIKYLQPADLLNKNITVTIRSDNGSQFASKMVREHLNKNQIEQEFIKPATPQQNGYIESFHATVEKLVCQKFEFDDIKHAQRVFEKFFETYNNKRILKCLLNKSPKEFKNEWENGKIGVVYKIKTKKQIFFFREKQNIKPVPFPYRRFSKGYSEDNKLFYNKYN